MNIYLHSSLNHRNFGDELLAIIAANELKSHKIYLKGNDLACNTLLKEYNNTYLIKYIPKKVDYMIFGGGGYFGAPSSKITKWDVNFIRRFVPLMTYVLYHKIRNLKMVGTGFGPNSIISSTIIRCIFKYSNSMNYVRDTKSLSHGNKILKSNKFTLIRDLASYKTLYPDFLLKLKVDKGNYIIIHDVQTNQLNDNFNKELINFIISNKLKVLIIADSDRTNSKLESVFEDWKKLFFKNDITINRYIDLKTTFSLIVNSQLVITSKLHIGIVSSTFNVPTVSIPIHIKTIRYYKSIEKESVCFPNKEVANMSLKMILNQNFTHGNDHLKTNCFEL
jgi:polysaccharide pyruvyl transferase WcaK-like protein